MDRLPVVHKQLLCLTIDPKGKVLSGYVHATLFCSQACLHLGIKAAKSCA